jgi:nucleoside-diphosphate-sugar epimerase
MPEINSFFRSKTVLITGATGFLGKALVARILEQLPQVRRIILLLRPHGLADPQASIRSRAETDILGSAIFDRLRASFGERFAGLVCEKIEVIPGDISCSDLGLTKKIHERLSAEVDLIVNLAAVVAFDEPLGQAVLTNVLGPRNLLDFAKLCRNPLMLHVSTAFVAGQRDGSIPETVLSPGLAPCHQMGGGACEAFRIDDEIERAIQMTRSVEAESQEPRAQREFHRTAAAKLRQTHRGNSGRMRAAVEQYRLRWVRERVIEQGMSRAQRFGWFDTYTFTKAMGEQLLVKHADGVPLVILRPSIIESSFRQPQPGWIEGFRMTTPILFGFGRGVVPDFPGNRQSIVDIIPVDFVVNALLASVACGHSRKTPAVFQLATGSENPLLLADLMGYCLEYFRQFPIRTSGSEPGLLLPWKYRSQAEFNSWLKRQLRMLNALLMFCPQMGFWPAAARFRRQLALKRLHVEQLEYYSRLYGQYGRISCRFETGNTRELFQSLNSEEQRNFIFDPSVIDWEKYIREIHLPGVRRHVLKR